MLASLRSQKSPSEAAETVQGRLFLRAGFTQSQNARSRHNLSVIPPAFASSDV